ncbi:Holliday junction endonuclease RuvC [Propionibacteriaceae bacterium ES.041]|uniref:crossover junction endodeoxyribonuclease RuvC n=1 Tax=Enemella evansiae TaxID=2016499 RepID=UPI000B95D4B7|nr:crossover junction endodeoxyribonuclease RuvC [Enemella evansiae]OYN99103.1 crossover junction endodeoxyribonuclease RuvC [Enemella evansiae]PFG67369.1 Holliday junction endonuclease RuvC [Propionibacteriaceae bacterium ES.041]
MRVLGIDPGLTRCGVGVVEGKPGRPPALLHVGVIRTDATLDTASRLVTIEQQLAELVAAWLPDVVAVERVFAQHNLNTVIGTAQAAGVAMLIGARSGIPVAQHTPSEVKAAITGSGRAEKQQIGTMVARVLRLAEPPKPADAADAVALAICQVWRGGTQNRLTEAVRRDQRARADTDELADRAAALAARQKAVLAEATRRASERAARPTERKNA